ncbi:glutamate--tRNA ligase [Niveibacterium terrae]|uniref:glutamate--tRNA ligase n=1 Tax=Niveibacterium terrae TaxID=3373598 RepID=UPI003A8D2FFF
MARRIRTRFAPSPTGFLHIGGARTALFSWAYARHHGGDFILRIEDTDLARSTPEAVQAILDGMKWLGLDWDEGPFYQMQRMDRYRQVIAEMLADGRAYLCYTTPEELTEIREAQRARGEKPRYDGRWRPEPGKVLPAVPEGVKPVVRFRNPTSGKVGWNDIVKGAIEFDNAELDDLIIARPDGTPTYNFCVVIDDWDMNITHVIRGDDHVNNTPRQINILRALGAEVPEYAHLSMILGPDGQKLSKRHGAVSVMQYDADGYLPDAVINYLARLGWSHGDDEVFSREKLVEWFDLDRITPSAAQFDFGKLDWLNAHYLRELAPAALAELVAARLAQRGVEVAGGVELTALVALYRERASTLVQLVDALEPFYAEFEIAPALVEKHLGEAGRGALMSLKTKFAEVDWNAAALNDAIKACCAEQGLKKMHLLAIPLRVALFGVEHTPSIDQVLELLGRERTLERLSRLG